jgi:hypothetical protein
MKKQILIFFFCSVFFHLHAQYKVFVLPNGVEIEGNWTHMNRDSITIQTKNGQFMVFSMEEIVQKPTIETRPTLFQKTKPWFMACNLGFQFGANDQGLWQGVGAEVKVLHRFRPDKQRFLYGKTGLEAVNGYQPALLIPLMVGFQGSVLKKNKHQIHLHTGVGYGFADTEEQEFEWQGPISATGSPRFETGFSWMILTGKESALSLGLQFYYQEATFTRENWQENITIKNQYKRTFINIGILF